MGLFQGTLYPFQRDHIARAFLRANEGRLSVAFNWDTGLGKSVAALQTAALLLEDSLADLVILVCERNKLYEWKEDIERFTPSLKVRIHHGANRRKKLETEGLPDVLISTYETYKLDLIQLVQGPRAKVRRPNFLLDFIQASGRVPFVILDEADKVRNRKSALYKAFDASLKALRKQHPSLSVAFLTATPISKDWENSFNILRLLAPSEMPTVSEFEHDYVASRDIFGKAIFRGERMNAFTRQASELILTKRKTDPDVMNQFPKKTERAAWVTLHPDQKKLYDAVSEIDSPGALTVLRQICAHPASLAHSEGKLSQLMVDAMGRDEILAIPSIKTQWLTEYLTPIILNEGEKAVVFTFFGQSVIPLIAQALESVGIMVHTYHGSLTDAEKERNKHLFKTGGPSVFLTSDAGAKGINLPEASHLVEYDMAPTFGLRDQRLNRVMRIGAGGPSVTIRSLIARDTVEVQLMRSMLKGNRQSDELLGSGMAGGNFMSASAREKALLEGVDDYLKAQAS